MEKDKLPQRKPTRLQGFDYSTPGAYFITICVKGKKQLLSKIVRVPVGDDAHIVPPDAHIVPPDAHIVRRMIGILRKMF